MGNIIAIIVYLVTFAVAWGSINEKIKSMASDILRIDKKQDKFNVVFERVSVLESKLVYAEHELEGIKYRKALRE